MLLKVKDENNRDLMINTDLVTTITNLDNENATVTFSNKTMVTIKASSLAKTEPVSEPTIKKPDDSPTYKQMYALRKMQESDPTKFTNVINSLGFTDISEISTKTSASKVIKLLKQ